MNLAAGDGHPVEIMDLSFAMQLLSALHIWTTRLAPGVSNVPEELDLQVGRLKLESLGIALDELTEEQRVYLDSWKED